MYYGKGGMGSIPIAMREHCQSFNNDDNEKSSFRIMQEHLWVSPSNGGEYIGRKTFEACWKHCFGVLKQF